MYQRKLITLFAKKNKKFKPTNNSILQKIKLKDIKCVFNRNIPTYLHLNQNYFIKFAL